MGYEFNLRYADDTTLMAESEEGSEKPGLKFNIQKLNIMAKRHMKRCSTLNQ